MELIPETITAFAEAHTSVPDPLLQELEDYTRLHHPEHHMLSGMLQGRLLSMISSMIRPRRIVEVGTFTGYSALCLANGLTEDGLLHTIEMREPDAAVARSFFERSPLGGKIRLHTGNALEILPQLEEEWDLAFIDADKPSYIAYFNLIFPRLRKNGFILADNIFFHGQALEADPKGKSAKGIRAFNDYLKERNDIAKLVLTIRDGLYLLQKL